MIYISMIAWWIMKQYLNMYANELINQSHFSNDLCFVFSFHIDFFDLSEDLTV